MGINIGPKESVKDGLLLFLDAANSASYPGSGTSWFDITPNRNSGSNSATLGGDNIPAYSNDYGGLIFVDNQSSGDFVPIGPTGYIYSSFDGNLASGSTQLTFEMWIRFYSSGAAIQTIFTFGSRYYLAIRTTLSRIAFYPASEAGAGGFGCGFTASDFGKWYHLVLVINADGTLDSVANNKMYFNGVQQSLDSSVTLTGPSSWAGFSSGGGSYKFMHGYQTNSGMWAPPSPGDGRKGRFDLSVFKVYNGELTQDQITQNFESLRARYGI